MKENPEDNLEQDSPVNEPTLGEKPTDESKPEDSFHQLVTFSVPSGESLTANSKILDKHQMQVGVVQAVAKTLDESVINWGSILKVHAHKDSELFVDKDQRMIPIEIADLNPNPVDLPPLGLPNSSQLYSHAAEGSAAAKVLNQSPPPRVAAEFEGIAANGGAIASVVLGIMTILGSLLTSWAFINGAMGAMLGLWGLSSKRPQLALLGILLCAIGTILVAVSVNGWVSEYWTPDPAVE